MFWCDLRLYLRLIVMQIRAQAQYKLNLTLDISTYFGVTALEFGSLLLYFLAFPTLLGWTMGQVALLAAMMSFGFGLAEMIGAGVDNFAETIKRGEFDRILLRPVGVVTQVIGSDFRLRRLGRLTEGLLGFVIALRLLPPIHWTASKIIVLGLGTVSGMVIFISVLFLSATICFWTVETTELTNSLYYGAREMMSYPITLYNQTLQRFFLFVVPVAFGSYIPVCYVLGKAFPFGLSSAVVFISPLFAFVFAVVTGLIWRSGVNHYQSTGS
jgi:ABC-2 type transport system permease protein